MVVTTHVRSWLTVLSLTEVFLDNPLVKVFVALRLGELAPLVEGRYSKRKRRPPLPWAAMVFFLLLMYLVDVRSQRQLARWLGKRSGLLRFFKLVKAPDHSSFTRFRQRLGKSLFSRVFKHLVSVCESMRLLSKRLVGQDSTFYKAWSNKRKQTDKEAKFGYTTKDEPLGYGYKAHFATDLANELPVSLYVMPANEHDSTGFQPVMQPLFQETVMRVEKFAGDSAYDDTNIRQELIHHNIQPCIAVNGRGHYESTPPNDPDYSKRSSCERSNSRAKEYFRLDDLKYRGLSNAFIHAALSLSAMLANAIAALALHLPHATLSPLTVRNALE